MSRKLRSSRRLSGIPNDCAISAVRPDVGTRRKYSLHTTQDGGVEIVAEHLASLVFECITEALSAVGDAAKRIVAVGCDTFWHSLMGVGDDHAALTPVYTWADTRSSAAA